MVLALSDADVIDQGMIPKVDSAVAAIRAGVDKVSFVDGRVAHAVWATKPGLFVYYIVVVEPDVDLTDMEQVLHAITTKCHPVNGIHAVPHIPGFPVLLPFLPPKT